MKTIQVPEHGDTATCANMCGQLLRFDADAGYRGEGAWLHIDGIRSCYRDGGTEPVRDEDGETLDATFSVFIQRVQLEPDVWKTVKVALGQVTHNTTEPYGWRAKVGDALDEIRRQTTNSAELLRAVGVDA